MIFSSVETESFGWEVGAGRGNAAFAFGASGSSSFGDSSFSSKTVEGDQVARSGRSISSDLGIDISLLCMQVSESYALWQSFCILQVTPVWEVVIP